MVTRAASFRILVATDGSAHARAALATAVDVVPWPDGARVRAVVAKQGRTQSGARFSCRRSIAALMTRPREHAVRSRAGGRTRRPLLSTNAGQGNPERS